MLEAASEISGRQPKAVVSPVRQFALTIDAALALWSLEASSSAQPSTSPAPKKSQGVIPGSSKCESGSWGPSVRLPEFSHFPACTISRHRLGACFRCSQVACLGVATAQVSLTLSLKGAVMLICAKCVVRRVARRKAWRSVACWACSHLDAPRLVAGRFVVSYREAGLWTFSAEGCYLYEHVFLLTTWKAAILERALVTALREGRPGQNAGRSEPCWYYHANQVSEFLLARTSP